MSDTPGERVTSLHTVALPYNKQVEFQQVVYDNGFAMLRLRIREGKRFTVLDLDADTATEVGLALNGWVDNNRPGQT